ncbi:MAG TPA: hypothetical protein VKT19_07155 [Steroidobacteraceae bacterium]|nr:hypothetical protein [Steroidobacteraceae bacterium]
MASMAPMAAPLLLRQLQGLLSGIYDAPVRYDVHDFLFTDRAWLPDHIRATDADEQVLVLEEHGATSVGVYLDPALLERLSAADPLRALNAANIADYWTALEGVSHFLYLAWNAGHDRAVSLLELELQAEIDKYVASWWLLRQQQPERFPAELHPLLFARARVDATLAAGRLELYRHANDYASRFCRRLSRQLSGAARSRGEALVELRRFYRLSRERKVRHIQRHDG